MRITDVHTSGFYILGFPWKHGRTYTHIHVPTTHNHTHTQARIYACRFYILRFPLKQGRTPATEGIEMYMYTRRFYILGFPWKHGRTPANEGMDNALKRLKDEMGGKFLVRIFFGRVESRHVHTHTYRDRDTDCALDLPEDKMWGKYSVFFPPG